MITTASRESKLRRSIRRMIIFFIVSIVISGLTAFPIETELAIAHRNINSFPEFLRDWISTVYFAVKATNENYPFLAYGTDWLAFAHLVIAVAFIGPLRDPVKNIWVIEFGIISSLMVFPLALIAGPIRQIPFYWQLIDCSFGVVALILLYICRRKIIALRNMTVNSASTGA